MQKEGKELDGSARDAFIQSALSMKLALPRDFPTQPPGRDEIQSVKQWTHLAAVDVHFIRQQAGYSLLFERRGERWVFVGVMKSWIV
jgi:hypothetical protein